MPDALTGLSVFLEENVSRYKGKALGLLSNQASVGPDYRHALWHLDKAMPGAVKVLFSPQHGFAGEKQDNMVESSHFRLPDGRPVYSLYGEKRVPEPFMLEGLDAVIADLPDMGTRVYTFAQTLFMFMEAMGKDIEIVVLDRPNPIGGEVIEGNILDEEMKSFVGLTPVPLRHGFTLGEHSLFANSLSKSPCSLSIVPCRNWKREEHFLETGLPWVLPSPNIPSPLTAFLYPGMVIFEGTMLSEGRGTTLPFHLVGAPYADPGLLASSLRGMKLENVAFREARFQPSFQKHAGKPCGGVEVHPLNKSFRPFLTALCILEAILKNHPDDFELKDPPYEYELERRPIDLILGRKGIFERLKKGESAKEIVSSFEPELKAFSKMREGFLLYR
jgi:uncharacterized protein YbbC (DUF1343 family)